MENICAAGQALQALCQWIASTQGAAELIVALDECSLRGRTISPQDLEATVLRFGTHEHRMRLIRTLRSMSIIQTEDDGFRLDYFAAHVTAPLRQLVSREVELMSPLEYADRVMSALEKMGALPPDPHGGDEIRYTNRIAISTAIGRLRERLIPSDAAAWLTRSCAALGNETPLALLARGEIERVLAHINAAGLALYF